VLCAGLLAGVGAAPAAAKAKPKLPHRVFVETNDPDGNAVQMFKANSKGKISLAKTYPTGSPGSPSVAAGFPFTESSGSVTLSHDGRYLLVVNHGGDTVTLFRVRPKGLKRMSTVASGGVAPVSVTINRKNKFAYVVNEGNPATISGFSITSKGKLKPLSNSTRTLAYPAGAPAQVAFNYDGKVLVVSDRQAGPGEEPDFIESFKVGKGGRPTALPPTPSTGQTPFGFAFTKKNILFMTNAHNDMDKAGSISTYKVSSATGTLTPADHQVTNRTATCWVVITKDQKHAFVSNTISAALKSYGVSATGGLTDLQPGADASGVIGGPFDIALSSNSKFLYVLNVDPGVIFNDPVARTDIEVFKVKSGGRITRVQTTKQFPTTTSGMAAW
jgi:6-phosphogluconolactonase (cycloisomerase 2 family)